MENNIPETIDYQKLIYEENLKQTELLEKQTAWIKKQTTIVSFLMFIDKFSTTGIKFLVPSLV